MNKRGFTLYLTILVTALVFMLVTGSQSISQISLDVGRSNILETLVFHAGDGGLEKGIAKIRNSFKPFEFNYKYNLDNERSLEIEVVAQEDEEDKSLLNLNSKVKLFEGGNLLMNKTYARNHIKQELGRNEIGRFMEVK